MVGGTNAFCSQLSFIWPTFYPLSTSPASFLSPPGISPPDIPSAVCGRSALPKDISAQIGQNKVQIWHIMARGDLQRQFWKEMRIWFWLRILFENGILKRITWHRKTVGEDLKMVVCEIERKACVVLWICNLGKQADVSMQQPSHHNQQMIRTKICMEKDVFKY